MASNSFISLLNRINGLENTKAVAEAQAMFTAKLHGVVREGGLSLERELHDWFGEARFNELLDGAAPSLEEATTLTQLISQHEMILASERRSDFEPIAEPSKTSTDATQALPLRLSPSQIVASIAGIITAGSLGLAITSMNAADEWQDDAARAEAFSARLVMMLARELPHDAPTPVIENVASDAIEYFEAHGEFADPSTLSDWSRIFTIVGRQRWNSGNTAGARQAFETSVAATLKQLDASPNSLDALFDHSQAVFWLADFNFRNADFDAAEAGFNTYATLTTELYETNPQSPLYQAEYAYGFLNRAIIDWERGRIEDALGGFTAALNDLSDVAENSDVVSALDIANARAWRASALFTSGQFGEASAERGRELAIYESVEDSAYVEHRRLAAMSQRAAARLALGDLAGAIPLIEDGSELAGQNLSQQPGNIEALRRYLSFMLQRVEVALAEDRLIAAKLIVDHARSALATYLDGADRIVPARETAQFSVAAAEVAIASGAYETASEEAASAIRVLGAENANEIRSLVLHAFAYQLAGEAEEAAGNDDVARRYYLQGIDLLRTEPGTIEENIVKARLNILLGNVAEANSLRDEIAVSGYSHPRDIAFWRRINQSGVVQTDTGENLNGG